jgi:hypothetical protein
MRHRASISRRSLKVVVEGPLIATLMLGRVVDDLSAAAERAVVGDVEVGSAIEIEAWAGARAGGRRALLLKRIRGFLFPFLVWWSGCGGVRMDCVAHGRAVVDAQVGAPHSPPLSERLQTLPCVRRVDGDEAPDVAVVDRLRGLVAAGLHRLAPDDVR